MSTILDALKKLQREKAAQNPGRDLRGSVANEAGFPRPRRRSGAGRALVGVALLALVAGGGWWAWSSGRATQLVARFAGGAGDGAPASEAELEALEREVAAAEVEAATPPPPAETAPAVTPPAAPRARAIAIPPAPPAPAQETPEMTAERARLEAVIAQAREAQEAQQRAEVAAATPPAAPAPVAPAPPPAPEAAAPPAAEAPKPAPAPVAKAAAPKPRAPIAKPKPAAKATAPPPRPKPAEPAPESVRAGVAFPTVSVESIRWHPIPERRVASLRFEQQNAPEAHEGDIVAGVLVYRIDPGAVELRIGDTQRVVRPGS